MPIIASGQISIADLSGGAVHVSTTPPESPAHDALWLDKTTDTVKRWNGAQWVSGLLERVVTNETAIEQQDVAIQQRVTTIEFNALDIIGRNLLRGTGATTAAAADRQRSSKRRRRKMDRLRKQQTLLRQEVARSLAGESIYESEMLRSMLGENKQAIASAEFALADCQHEIDAAEARLQRLFEQYRHIQDWARVFEHAGDDSKKMILARLIDRVDVDRDYHLTICFS